MEKIFSFKYIFRIFLIIFCITACAHIKHTTSAIVLGRFYTDKEFEPYIKKVITLHNTIFKSRFQHTPIVFDEFYDDDYGSTKVAGTCYTNPFTPNYIVINRKVWNMLSEKQKQLLIMHELGHCSYGQMHFNKNRKDGCPVSLMGPVGPDFYCAEKHYDSYVRHFFWSL